MSKKYWCPMCGDLAPTANPFPWLPGTAYLHGPACLGVLIPSVEPLAVPEPTTWGESGGADAVCLSVYFDEAVFIRDDVFAWVDSIGWRVSDGDRVVENTDIVTAINYVAGCVNE
jgi:hypothetical protein